MQRSFKVHELWPTPLYENYINVKPEWVNKSKNFEYVRMYSDNGDYTKNKEILNELPDLKEEIYKNVILFTEKYLHMIDVNFYFTNSWVVKHYPNDWAQAHNHTNSLLSGVYYLETEKNLKMDFLLKGQEIIKEKSFGGKSYRLIRNLF